jgi:hypothetical protein
MEPPSSERVNQFLSKWTYHHAITYELIELFAWRRFRGAVIGEFIG